MEDLEELKQEVKNTLITDLGEEGYYKRIAESLEKLVPIKELVDAMFKDEEVSLEEKREEFKNAVMDALVFEQYEDENDQIFYIGYYELVLDVFEF